MKMTELAKELGVSPQAVYKRLRAAGYDIADFKSQKTGELTIDGADRIRLMFKQSAPVKKEAREVHDIEMSKESTVYLKDKVVELSHRVDVLEAEKKIIAEERDNWERRYDDLFKISFQMRQTIALVEPQLRQKKHRSIREVIRDMIGKKEYQPAAEVPQADVDLGADLDDAAVWEDPDVEEVPEDEIPDAVKELLKKKNKENV